jgi:hypothetical protein
MMVLYFYQEIISLLNPYSSLTFNPYLYIYKIFHKLLYTGWFKKSFSQIVLKSYSQRRRSLNTNNWILTRD